MTGASHPWQFLVDAVHEYVRTFEDAQRSDGSDPVAQLHQLSELAAVIIRALRIGPVLMKGIECLIGPPPAQPPPPADPTAEAQYRDDLARWVMRAWQIMCQVFLLPALGAHPLLDALHNEADRGLTGGALQFFRTLAPQHGNKRDVFRRTAKDAMVFSVILAAAELDGKERYKRVLNSAGVNMSERTFTANRQSVDDKAALKRIEEEADRRRDNRRIREKADRKASRSSRGRRAAPVAEKPMDTALIAGPLSDAEQMALYPERHKDLAGLGTATERVRYLFQIWNSGTADGSG